MSQAKKLPLPQFDQLSSRPQIPETSRQITQSTIYPAERNQKYLTEVDLETTKLIKKSPQSGFQSFCVILLIGIMAIAVVVFASITINCLISKQIQSQNIKSNDSTATSISIDNDNETQLSKRSEQNTTQINQKNQQISTLNTKVTDLEFELQKLQTELKKEKTQLSKLSEQDTTEINKKNQQILTLNIKVDDIEFQLQKLQTELTKEKQKSQLLKASQQNITEIKKKNQQISTLNIKIADLEFQLQKLQAELKKEKQKSQQLQNGAYVIPSQPINPTNQAKPVNPEKPNEQQNSQFTVRSAPRNGIPPGGDSLDRYEFTIAIDQVVANSPISYTFPTNNSEWSGIKKQEYQRAIRLMEVVHNVNIKGQYVLDNYKFYKTPEDKYNALSKILDDQRAFYDKKYETSKYIHDQIGICVYLPSFNNAKNRLYLRNLDSVFQQQYKNYHVVYVNDASTDRTGEYVQFYMEENQIPKEKYVLINNQKNKGNCANIYMAAHQYCNPGEIMVLLDGDDVLIGRQVFSLLNAVYQKQKVALTYGQFLLVRNNQVTSGFSRDIPFDYLQKGRFRKLRGFFTSHLKTMYVDVMRAIKETDLQYANGTFYDYASDVAYMTAAIDLVGTRLKFLKQLNYEYRFDTGANEPHQQQIIVEFQVYDKPPLKKMENMSFADNPKTVHYP